MSNQDACGAKVALNDLLGGSLVERLIALGDLIGADNWQVSGVMYEAAAKMQKMKAGERLHQDLIDIDGDHWVVVSETNVSMALHRAKSRFVAHRIRIGISQEEMANRLGVSQSYLCKIEIGTRPCPTELAERIMAMTPNNK